MSFDILAIIDILAIYLDSDLYKYNLLIAIANVLNGTIIVR